MVSKPQITIWIHGTRLLPVELFKNFFYSKPGLHPLSSYESRYHLYTIGNQLCSIDPTRFSQEYFYLFGWSGKLSRKTRMYASQELSIALSKVIESYQNIFQERPFIRIITHSHGGNVALNIARWYTPDKPLFIDELILLACPVQEETKHYVQSTGFKKIFSLYSSSDIIQVLDPQGLYRLLTRSGDRWPIFSERLFPTYPSLLQAHVKINGHGLMHIDFILPKFLHHFPHILFYIEEIMRESPTAFEEELIISLATK